MWLGGGEPETSIGAMAAFQSPPAETISYKNKWPGNRTKNKAPGTFTELQTGLWALPHLSEAEPSRPGRSRVC